MSRYIVKLDEFYLEWSTIVDAPVTFGMRFEEFKEYYHLEYGRDGMRDLGERLERVFKWGTSCLHRISASELVSHNRAGPDKSTLTEEQIYKAYCLREPILDSWLVPVVEQEGTKGVTSTIYAGLNQWGNAAALYIVDEEYPDGRRVTHRDWIEILDELEARSGEMLVASLSRQHQRGSDHELPTNPDPANTH